MIGPNKSEQGKSRQREGAAELEPASTKLATREPEGVLNGRVVDLCDDRFYVRRKIKRQNSNSSHLVL
jgi:hypothetical protein